MMPSFAGMLTTLLVTAMAGNVPGPALSPGDVVSAQLRALAGDDAAHHDGIRRTFLFASPGNKLVTGPEQRFVELVQTPAYAPLLGSRRFRIRDERRDGDSYQAVAEVVGRDGRTRLFGFQLGRQADGPLKGCWMTEGVTPLQPAPPAQGRGVI